MEETNKKHRWKYLEREWHSDESASLAQFVIGFCLYFKGLSLGPLVFLPPEKLKFQFNLETVDMESYLMESSMRNTKHNYYHYYYYNYCYYLLGWPYWHE